VARTIAGVLFGLQLKPSDKIVETTALDLTAAYVGQTGDKVNQALREAKGGILFVDEAYNLGQGGFGKEACDTLVAGMTSDEFRDVQIIFFLGRLHGRYGGHFSHQRWSEGSIRALFRLPGLDAPRLRRFSVPASRKGGLCSLIIGYRPNPAEGLFRAAKIRGLGQWTGRDAGVGKGIGRAR